MYRSSLSLLNNAQTVIFIVFANKLLSTVNKLQQLTVRINQKAIFRLMSLSVTMWATVHVWGHRDQRRGNGSSRRISCLSYANIATSCAVGLYHCMTSSNHLCFDVSILPVVFDCFFKIFDIHVNVIVQIKDAFICLLPTAKA